jgi:predicted site-specific integrase-resolvase
LVVAELAEVKDRPGPDMGEMLTSFCARLYGRRSARSRAKKSVEAMRQ